MNLMMPGNPRYQPKELQHIFGYDNLYSSGLAQVEIAVLHVLADIGVIPKEDFADFTPEVEKKLLAITTTEVDQVEREKTKHDVRAWVRIAQEIVGPRMARWMHVPLTSYDVLDTGRTLQFRRAHDTAIRPAVAEVFKYWTGLVFEHMATRQIGRTHGQHALPITVGFWLSTILSRALYCAEKADQHAEELVGKISGAVGAYNAQRGLGIAKLCEEQGMRFEDYVLGDLGLKTARISTQILPPEPLTSYLFWIMMLSGALAQLARDCRHLMRSEIREVAEAREPGQVGSSTMAQKENPVNFEGIESAWLKTKHEFGKVLEVTISDHQRDLVNSAIARDFPVIVINLMTQLNTLRRKNKDGHAFLSRLTINTDTCKRNLEMSASVILAEPMYIAMQMAGYEGDAHEFVMQKLVPSARNNGCQLIEVLEDLAENDSHLEGVLARIPTEVKTLLRNPESYIGDAVHKSMEIVGCVTPYLTYLQR